MLHVLQGTIQRSAGLKNMVQTFFAAQQLRNIPGVFRLHPLIHLLVGGFE